MTVGQTESQTPLTQLLTGNRTKRYFLASRTSRERFAQYCTLLQVHTISSAAVADTEGAAGLQDLSLSFAVISFQSFGCGIGW